MDLKSGLARMRPYEQAAIERLHPTLHKTYYGLLGGVWATIIVGGLDLFPQGTASGSVYRLGEDTNAFTLITASLIGAASHAMAAVLFGQDWRVSPKQLYGVYGLIIAMTAATLPIVLALIVRILPFIFILTMLAGIAFALYWRLTGQMPPFLRSRSSRDHV